MKKSILIVALVVLALGVFGVGAAFAQDGTPPFGGRGPMLQDGTTGPLHTFMVAEFAKKLDLNVNDINTRLAAGESMYDIASSVGVNAEEFPAVMTEVRADALDAAVKAEVITQVQADRMKSRGAGMMNGAGFNGECPMQDGDTQNGFRGGPAGMMGNGNGNGRGTMNGWGSQQVNP